MGTGKVYLVGAGPGDIGLITVKGLEAIKQAEVILYDRLANPKLLEFAPADCELIYCGKLPERHILRQENINDLLVKKAQEGKMVVRLKGGDPGVFGRVGEEAEALAEHQIPFEIVPGITSGIAAPLYAGIPVTHREHAESFAVITAHDKSEDGKPVLNWDSLARGIDTIAFYMGVRNLPFICENLIAYGKPANTPVILIQWGTFGRQKTLQGTLADISDKVKEAKFSNPAIILVGPVISLREKIKWFENKPLYGRQIILARTSESPSDLAKELAAQGADVIEFPKWNRITLPVNPEILAKIDSYDQILFTSPESVDEFFKTLYENQFDIRRIRAELFGVSNKSLNALRERGFIPLPANEMSEMGKRLVVCDNQWEKDENADVWLTSEKVLDPQFLPIFRRMLDDAIVNTVVFPNSASVEPFMRGLRECGIHLMENVQIVSMGKQTMNAVMEQGLPVSEMPKQATKEALIELLASKPIEIM
ncbi:uroporphyrinogen-III C-methyltransferase [Neobacillus sedimentimangrovi]|jgi:uroporphyrin-III C-methyltransferase|uniref:uroporphyrinogen-III C-methyltransferase n=1 Tax=Neobacillus sedimentimangrovi TaxID=2699460 RepID=UPI0013D79536|nr:uroporphyrinogen-III C-methyltransferase [Neobacillus sedimentimangrovi]